MLGIIEQPYKNPQSPPCEIACFKVLNLATTSTIYSYSTEPLTGQAIFVRAPIKVLVNPAFK